MAGFDVLSCHLRASREGACQIECLDGEWLIVMCCHAIYARFDRALVESSVWMGNGWVGCAVLPLTFVSSGCLWNRASRWGMAGFDVVCCH